MQSGSYFSLIEAEGKRRKDEPIEVFCPPAETEIEPKIEEKVTDPTLINFAGRWNRIALAPGLELHYQEGGPQDTSEARERLAHLVELAMRLYF